MQPRQKSTDFQIFPGRSWQGTLSPTASPTAGFREGRLKPKCGDDEELSKKLCDDWKLMAFMGRTRILNDDQSAQLRI